MTKPLTKTIQPVPEDNQCKGPGSAPSVPLDTTKGHRDDEKRNIRGAGGAREFGAEHDKQKVGVSLSGRA